jgi:hypothetical protein
MIVIIIIIIIILLLLLIIYTAWDNQIRLITFNSRLLSISEDFNPVNHIYNKCSSRLHMLTVPVGVVWEETNLPEARFPNKAV